MRCLKMGRNRTRLINGIRHCNSNAGCYRCTYENDRDCAKHMYHDALLVLEQDERIITGIKRAIRALGHEDRNIKEYLLMVMEKLERGQKL